MTVVDIGIAGNHDSGSSRAESGCPPPAAWRRVALRRSGGEPPANDGVEEKEEDLARTASRRAIVCAACRHPVTDEDRRIRVKSRHQHRCVNPHGILFHIGCFRDAPGCTVSGRRTTEFTWFPGFAWQYAQCGACAAHLGWRFQAVEKSFFGLILDRLWSEEPA